MKWFLRNMKQYLTKISGVKIGVEKNQKMKSSAINHGRTKLKISCY